MTETKTESQLAKDFEKLIKKASAANSEMMGQATQVVNHLLTHKVEIQDLSKMNTSIVTSALEDLVQMSLQHTSGLLDWGVALSKHISGQITKNTNSGTTTKTAAPAAEVFRLSMNGNAGEMATTSFLLNSDKDNISTGYFNLSPFISEDGSDVLKTALTVSPMSFSISKEQPLRIDMAVAIPVDATPGVYNSRVQVQGFDNTEFLVALTVNANEITIIEEEPAQPAKKAAARKPAAKRKGGKK